MPPSLPDAVRDACAGVAATAAHVSVVEAAVDAYAASLAATGLRPRDADRGWWAVGGPEVRAAFAVTWNAVSFGSGWFPVVAKIPGRSGAQTMAAHLRERVATQGPWSAAELVALTAGDCAAVFGQDAAGPAAPLMGHFAGALNELGRFLLERFGGSFTALVAAAGGSAVRLVELLGALPHFQDVASHRGRPVPFYKRAQLTAADVSAAFGGEGPGRFGDLDTLTIFADNLVPHVLRVDGVLRHTPELAARIEREELLAPGSEEEVEIRACGVHAAELLVAALRRRGVWTTAMDLDVTLWHRGQEPRYKAVPRHRCRSVFY